MNLRELIEQARVEPPLLRPSAEGGGLSAEELATEVSDLAYRSGTVSPGALFFCVRGFRADGHDFADAAVKRGAVALVCERPLGLGVPEVLVSDVRIAMAPLAAAFFGDPTESLRMVGVTGTNGKTTTAFLVRDIMEAAGWRSGLLGTVQSVVAGAVEEVERTTPEAIDLQRTFRRMVDGGDEACAMEVSSHALELHRADAIHFDCALFTNLTQDHLDFHGTLEQYFGAKRSLFVPARTPLPRVPVINLDDDWGHRLVDELIEGGRTETVTFSLRDAADFRAEDVELDSSGSRFTCKTSQATATVELPLRGLFNVYNALGALAACCSLDVELEVGARALRSASQVPGRLEAIDEGQPFMVIVDYAHTPDSLENVLRTARELVKQTRSNGRVICVFGAGGDRDREKRPLMGAVARSLADYVIVSSDNPRSEDPDAIIASILEGAGPAGGEHGGRSILEVEPDRAAAIERAVRIARPEDIVVIAGKGHEQGQEFADGRKIPFDDRKVARQALREAGAGTGRPADRPAA